MTTDLADAPAEVTPPEPLTPPPETTVATPEATAAAEPTEATAPPEEVTSFLKEQGLADEGEGAAVVTEGKAADIPVEEIKAQAAKEERDRLIKQGRIEGIRQAYPNHAARMVEAGRKLDLKDEEIRPLLGIMAELNGQSASFHAQNFVDGLYASIAEVLPQSQRQPFLEGRDKHTSYADALVDYKKAVLAEARTGYVSEKEAKKQAAEAVRTFGAELQKKGLLSGSKTISTDTSVSSSRNGVAPDKVLEDVNTSREDKSRAFEKKYGFKPS